MDRRNKMKLLCLDSTGTVLIDPEKIISVTAIFVSSGHYAYVLNAPSAVYQSTTTYTTQALALAAAETFFNTPITLP
jgi:hypothetical protein